LGAIRHRQAKQVIGESEQFMRLAQYRTPRIPTGWTVGGWGRLADPAGPVVLCYLLTRLYSQQYIPDIQNVSVMALEALARD
jgi:hypothetical protein